MSRFLISRVFTRAAFVSVLAAVSMVQAPLTAQLPDRVDAVVHCPDGTTRQIETNTDPAVVEANPMLLQFTCNQPETPNPAPAAPSPTQQAVPPSASATVGADGLIHCPDGTTRPGFVRNDEMSGLAVSMACSKPAADSAQASAAMTKKNVDLAANGQVGTWEAVKIEWETGDMLLNAKLAGKFFVFAVIIGLVVFLLRRKK